MTNLETMQREGREALKKDFNNLYQKEYTTDFKEKRLIRNTEIDIMSLDNLDQHTANTWNEARESLIVDMKRTMKGWSGTGTAMIKDYETLARDYD